MMRAGGAAAAFAFAALASVSGPADRNSAMAAVAPPCVLMTTVTEHYGRTSADPKASCTLDFPLLSDPNITSKADASLDDDGMKVSFTFAQPTLVAPRDIFLEDTLRVSLSWDGNKRHAQYIVSAYGRCKLVAPNLFLNATESCSASITTRWTPQSKKWKGSVSLSYAQLQRFHVPPTFTVDILREYWRPGANHPAQLRATAQVTTVRNTATAAVDRYVAGGPDIGNPPAGTSRHRAVANVYAPLSVNALVTSTFSDDAGPLLNIRNDAVKSILTDQQAKKFTCRTCGSFFSDDQQPFTQPITSTNVLGVDFGKLGVDRLPFESAAVSFPVDAGYKLITTGDDSLALAAFNGNAGSSGVARDGLATYQRSLLWSDSALRFSVFHATANRSMPPPPPLKMPTFPNVLTAVRHTDDTLATVGYSIVPKLTASAGTIPESPVRNVSVLARYGTQYGPLASNFTAAVSIQRDPPLLNLFSENPGGGHLSGAVGYRNVGPNYLPMDSRFDIYTGLHGWFGILEYKGAIPRTNKPYDLKVSAYRMSDALEARDASMDLDVKIPLRSELALEGSYGTSALAVSQAARANKFVVSDLQHGALFLPNGHYSAALTYTTPDGAFRASAGYARAQSQSCNKNATVLPPCYGFINGSATGSIAWQAFSDVFLDASLKNASSDPFRTGGSDFFPDPSKDFYSTTASHVEYAYAIGANILKTKAGACSTFLLTSTNRTSGIDVVANTPNQPRFAKTASLELVPGTYWPTMLVAYSRVGFIDPTQPSQTMFVVRVQYGIQPKAYGEAISRRCK